MAINILKKKQSYGPAGNQLTLLYTPPVVTTRAPTSSDLAPLGQLWDNKSTNTVYMLTSSGVWTQLVASSGSGVFSSLTVTGPSTLTGTTNINTSGASVTNIGVGATGAVNIGNATGNTSISAGNFVVSLGNIEVVTGNITADLGNIAATLGTVTGGAGVIATTGGVTATAGNITATNGNVVLSTAGTHIALPGPVFIYSGAGAPSNALALHVGDMYINTTAASATTRLYIATAANTWTNVTCAA